MLVNSHCHLDFPDFSAELDDVVVRARNAGIGHMLTICTHVRKFPAILAVAERFPDVTCSVGTHPHSASEERDVRVSDIIGHTAHPRVVAIGEAGPGFFHKKNSPGGQEGGFLSDDPAGPETSFPV